MHILVFGHTGQVARALQNPALHRQTAGADRGAVQITALGRDRADLADPAAITAALAGHDPDAVINAAAYTAVDTAETEAALAHAINGHAPGVMARACAARDIPFVTISTDYVFDGQGTRPWQPQDPTGPLGVYGRSKLAGEDAVRAAGGRFAILRTSWVFSVHGQNFVKTMLRLGAARDAVTVVGDQIGGPTPAHDIAAACLVIARSLAADATRAGTYHFSGAPDVSWAGFAREIFRQSGLACTVTPIPTTQYPTPATRPLNSRMDCAATTQAFGLARPDWAAGLAQVLDQTKDTPA